MILIPIIFLNQHIRNRKFQLCTERTAPCKLTDNTNTAGKVTSLLFYIITLFY